MFVWKLACKDPVEKLYYSAKFEDMCAYCAQAKLIHGVSDQEQCYPQCKACEDKDKIPNSRNSITKM